MIINRLMALIIGTLTLSALGMPFAELAFAIERPLATESSVVGSAHFEKRYTLVPLGTENVCQNDFCPKSEPYWALVLENNGTQYEMDSIFDRGDTRSPEMLNVLGTIIRPGSRVVLDGELESFSNDYSVISQVKRASLVMDVDH